MLFQPEATRLTSLEAGDSLQRYVGNADRLPGRDRRHPGGALERAEVNPARLATTIAPVVVSAIRNEIKNSREQMIEALYPIVGRLVSAAVANAFRRWSPRSSNASTR